MISHYHASMVCCSPKISTNRERSILPDMAIHSNSNNRHLSYSVLFALNTDRLLASLAVIWRPWTGVGGTKAEPVKGGDLFYSFLSSYLGYFDLKC